MKKLTILNKVLFLALYTSITHSISAQSVDVKIGDESLNFVTIGRANLDGAVFTQDKTDLDNGIAFSDIRLGTIGKYKKYTVKVELGYSNNKVAMRDVFVRYNLNEKSYAQIGHIIEPFGAEYLTGATYATFISASSASNAFSSNRKIGLEYIGWNKLYWVGGGIYSDPEAINNDKRGDQGYGVSGRFILTPFKEKGKFLHLGLAGIINKAGANGRDENGDDKHNREFKFVNILSSVDKIPTIKSKITNANYQLKYNLEFIGGIGPVYVQGEYFHSYVKRRSGDPSYIADGGYAQLAFLAIGGDYNYNPEFSIVKMPRPKSLEFAARYGYTNLNRAKEGFISDKGGNMSDLTIGANYFINKYMAIKFNYSYVSISKHAPILPSEKFSVFETRCQIVF